ncbi:MAG: DinB family protein [Anaerolineae bacterium]|nr:DinB family protein [Anaerolineae bacterium]
MDHRKNWTREQDRLRKLLGAKTHFAEAQQVFFQQHAAVHSAALYNNGTWSLQDEALAPLSEDLMRLRLKPDSNSVAWLLWHITRIEDMTINRLVFKTPQVLDTGNWLPLMNMTVRDCGAGMTPAGVADLSARIHIPALLDYRLSVGQQTRQLVRGLTVDKLKEDLPTPDVMELVEEGSISRSGFWLAEYYTGRIRAFFLTRTATSHNFIHLAEAARTAVLILKSKEKKS